MAKASDITEKAVVEYAKHEFDPLESLDFIQLSGFSKNWVKLRLDDQDMGALRVLIAAAPNKPPVVPGTGGVRKLRFSSPRLHRGKSSGVRVCYAYYPEHGLALLLGIYGKNRKDDLTQEERNGLKKVLAEFEKKLERRPLH